MGVQLVGIRHHLFQFLFHFHHILAGRQVGAVGNAEDMGVHRDGRFAQVYWTYADLTIEEKIARVVAGRIQSMKEMIGDEVETLREIEALLLGAGD